MDSSSKYAVVVGSMNMDISAKSFLPLLPSDSNPGEVHLSPGGVGRNIAQNLSQLGTRVFMLTALACDANAAVLEKSCATCGVDISRALRIAGGNTPTYVFIAGPDGDMALAVCDAELTKFISPAYLAENLDVLNNAAAVVIETNLMEEAIAFLAENCKAPIFADPVSVTKGEKLIPVMSRLHTLKPNRLEAEALSGIKITDEDSLNAAANALLATGLKRVFISLGAEGLLYSDKLHRFREPCLQAELVNATGGGDAMMSAVVKAFVEDMTVRETARLALAASAICVESKETISRKLSFGQVMRRAKLNKNGGSHGF